MGVVVLGLWSNTVQGIYCTLYCSCILEPCTIYSSWYGLTLCEHQRAGPYGTKRKLLYGSRYLEPFCYVSLCKAMYVDGSCEPPPAIVWDKELKEVSNPTCFQWMQRVQSWMNATLFLEMLQLVVLSPENKRARAVWLALEKYFIENIASRVYAWKSEQWVWKKESMWKNFSGRYRV